MNDIEQQPIEGQMDFITFKDFVEQITGTSFEKIYKDALLHGESNEQSNME